MATVFAVKAAAGKRAFSASILSENPLTLKVDIPAAPQKGAANRELVFRLEKLLGCPVGIIAGQKSRSKTLAAGCSAEHLLEKVKQKQR